MKPLFTAERRACMVEHREGKKVEEKRAFFHLFSTSAYPVEPSPLRGGHPGGQVSAPVAIVEYEDGAVELVDPCRVRFLDTKELMEQHARDEKPEKSCLTCEYNENGINRPCSNCKDFDKWEAPHNEWDE